MERVKTAGVAYVYMYSDIAAIFDTSRTQHVRVRDVQPIRITENSKYCNIWAIFKGFLGSSRFIYGVENCRAALTAKYADIYGKKL